MIDEYYNEKFIDININRFPSPFKFNGIIVIKVFLLLFNQMEFHLVQNQMKNCCHDHIPFNLKGNGILVFSVNTHSISNLVTLKQIWNVLYIHFSDRLITE